MRSMERRSIGLGESMVRIPGDSRLVAVTGMRANLFGRFMLHFEVELEADRTPIFPDEERYFVVTNTETVTIQESGMVVVGVVAGATSYHYILERRS